MKVQLHPQTIFIFITVFIKKKGKKFLPQKSRFADNFDPFLKKKFLQDGYSNYRNVQKFQDWLHSPLVLPFLFLHIFLHKLIVPDDLSIFPAQNRYAMMQVKWKESQVPNFLYNVQFLYSVCLLMTYVEYCLQKHGEYFG